MRDDIQTVLVSEEQLAFFTSNLCVAAQKNRFSRIPPKQIITQWLVYQIWPVKPLFVYQNGHPLAPNSTTNQHEFYTHFVF